MKTVVWDVDDVLNDLMGVWLEAWRADHPAPGVSYDDITENPPHRILGLTLEEYLGSLDGFRLSQSYRDMKPLGEVMDWFRENGSRFRHIALTSPSLKGAAASAAWVLGNYGAWIRTYHLVPNKRGGENIPAYDRNKGEALAFLGKADLFIDDSPANLASAREAGVRVLTFPRPWNGSSLTVAETLSTITALLTEQE